MKNLLLLALAGTGFAGVASAQAIPSNCAETLFARNNGGSAGGAVYFDVTITQPVSFAGLLSNTMELTPVGMTVYTTPGTYVGQEANMAAWTQVAEDDGTSVGLGNDLMTPFTFVAPFMLAPGTYGMALQAENFTTGFLQGHDYTTGNGTQGPYVSADGIITLTLGAASNVAFAGTPFTPRIWNGRLCSSAPSTIGMNYCTAIANSTGAAASMSASGSAAVANNDLTVEASDMPQNSFGFFISSSVQGFVANPGGSAGNLCLGGAIGRFVGPGQIQNSGAAGAISLLTDNTMQPTPTGIVAIAAGETWNYTAWFRDTDGMGGATSNFADGLEVMFQ